MTTRELFEAEFPVPWGVRRDDEFNYIPSDTLLVSSMRATNYNSIWIGFQAGVKAKERVK